MHALIQSSVLLKEEHSCQSLKTLSETFTFQNSRAELKGHQVKKKAQTKEKEKNQFAKSGAHILIMFVDLHTHLHAIGEALMLKPTRSHTDSGFQINARRESMHSGGGKAKCSGQRYIQKGKRPASGTAAEESEKRENESGRGEGRDTPGSHPISPKCSLIPDAAHLQQIML